MLTVIRDATGRLEAAAEWVPTDDHGHPSNYGTWCFVNQLEVSKGVDSKQSIRKMIVVIAENFPQAIGAFWQRKDSTVDKAHGYARKVLLRFAQREGVGVR